MKNSNFQNLVILLLLTSQLCIAQPDNIRVDLETIFQKDPDSPNTTPDLVEVGYTDFFYANGGTKFTMLYRIRDILAKQNGWKLTKF